MRSETGEFRSGAGAASEGPAPALRLSGEGVGSDSLPRGTALAERARGGDRAAFTELYREYGALVHAVLLARVPRPEAEDLTQEVFLRAWRRLGELRESAAVGAWLVAIARSSASDWARADARRRVHEGRAVLAARTAHAPDAARADTVLDVIRGLPEAYREPLVLRFVAGLTGPQIAACLGMTHGSVRVNLHRGMAMLRETLPEDRS